MMDAVKGGGPTAVSSMTRNKHEAWIEAPGAAAVAVSREKKLGKYPLLAALVNLSRDGRYN